MGTVGRGFGRGKGGSTPSLLQMFAKSSFLKRWIFFGKNPHAHRILTAAHV
jgi:hypothetical protein